MNLLKLTILWPPFGEVGGATPPPQLDAAFGDGITVNVEEIMPNPFGEGITVRGS